MDQQDRLAYEAAMAALRDAREDCLRSLTDTQPPRPGHLRPTWWFDVRTPHNRPSEVRPPLAS